jgi:hypothetical protein
LAVVFLAERPLVRLPAAFAVVFFAAFFAAVPLPAGFDRAAFSFAAGAAPPAAAAGRPARAASTLARSAAMRSTTVPSSAEASAGCTTSRPATFASISACSASR